MSSWEVVRGPALGWFEESGKPNIQSLRVHPSPLPSMVDRGNDDPDGGNRCGFFWHIEAAAIPLAAF